MSRSGENGRANIIQTVQTPLGFFTLVVLVGEIVIGTAASLSQGSERTYLIVGMVVLLFLLVGIVLLLAVWRPEALVGGRPSTLRGAVVTGAEESAPELTQSARLSLRLLTSREQIDDALYRSNESIVKQAKRCLAIAGSRASNPDYFAEIEETVRNDIRGIDHYRVLIGPPRYPVFVDHLNNLLRINRPDRIKLAAIINDKRQPEVFICSSESKTLITIPPQRIRQFDTALLIEDQETAQDYTKYVVDLYEVANIKIRSSQDFPSLEQY